MSNYVKRFFLTFKKFVILYNKLNPMNKICIFISKIMKEKRLSVQDWLDVEKIIENGIIKLKNNKYIKLIKIIPINFNLKSNFEKESILNSYKIFLKTCNFNIQIIIQNCKEDLQKNLNNINENLKKENKEYLNSIGKDYINYLTEINSVKSSKNFFIAISNNQEENKLEELIVEELNEKYFKIKECLLRCGNSVKNINTKKETEKILFSFLNTRLFLK